MFSSTDPGAIGVSAATLNPLVHAIYPLDALTKWHHASHLPGLTGRWMDTGATALGGAVRGPWHRLAHGHHFVEDGLRVVAHPQLKYGEFLHHLGLDFFTKTGIPNPIIPKMLGEFLLQSGLSRNAVNELLTVNMPKLLGGGLSLVCSGMDVYAVFSDTIPHTLGAAGKHFLIGAVEVALGCFPPNPLLLAAGGAEWMVSTITAVRAICEPVVQMSPLVTFLPTLGSSVLISGVFSTVAGTMMGRSRGQIVRSAAASMTAAGVSTTVAAAVKATGLTLTLAGPMAGIATSCLMYHLLKPRPVVPLKYKSAVSSWSAISPVPGIALPDKPIGRLENGHLRLQ